MTLKGLIFLHSNLLNVKSLIRFHWHLQLICYIYISGTEYLYVGWWKNPWNYLLLIWLARSCVFLIINERQKKKFPFEVVPCIRGYQVPTHWLNFYPPFFISWNMIINQINNNDNSRDIAFSTIASAVYCDCDWCIIRILSVVNLYKK